MQIPRANQVDQSIKKVTEAVESALQALNEKAGSLMAKGRYSEAEALAQKGREIQAFIEKVKDLGQDWKALKGQGKKPRLEKTPLWAYYQPVLQAIVDLGGQARRADFEPLVFQSMRAAFRPGDTSTMSGGQRWQVMIRRCRKHLIHEGWLEDDPAGRWIITDAGRLAASAKNHTKFQSSKA